MTLPYSVFKNPVNLEKHTFYESPSCTEFTLTAKLSCKEKTLPSGPCGTYEIAHLEQQVRARNNHDKHAGISATS